MSKKENGLLKKIAVTGAIAGAACAAAGSAFIEQFLSKKGISKLAAKGGFTSPEEMECFINSEEAIAGTEFYRKTVYRDIFTFNKHSKCLHAIFYDAPEKSDVFVISCHGYMGNPTLNKTYIKHFYEMGFNVLLPYLRGHGKSEHNYCTMGWLDRLDIIDWIEYIRDLNPKAKIILHGVSMGAATVMMTTGEELPDNVVCCIEDCGYTTLWDEYSVQLKELYNLPSDIVLNILNPIFKMTLGFDIKSASALKQVKKSKTPTLFIHGDKDAFVPFWMNYPLYQNASCEKERLVVPGAHHAASVYLCPELYWNTVTEFIKKYI